MNIAEILSSALAAAAVVLTALINLRAERQRKQNQQSEAMRRRFVECGLSLLAANTALTKANTVAIQTGKSNGELDAALGSLREVTKQYRAFLNEMGVQTLF